MDFVRIATFDNYIDAHISLGQLEGSGIPCWLQDENTVTTYPILTQVVGGIKLIVRTEDEEAARNMLKQFRSDRQTLTCPSCGSNKVELVTSPRKASNWISALLGFLLGNYAIGVKGVHHCFDCGHETDVPVEDPV